VISFVQQPAYAVPAYGQAPPPYSNSSYGAGYTQPPAYAGDGNATGNTQPPQTTAAKTSPQNWYFCPPLTSISWTVFLIVFYSCLFYYRYPPM